jgi:hypothetical protein
LQKKISREEKSTPRVTLFPDEMVVMTAHPARVSTLPRLIGTLGTYEFWRKRDTAVVTNRRILFGKGIFRRTEKSIPLTNVTDVVFVRRGANCYAEVAISDRGRGSVKLIGPMSGSTARRLVSEILRQL